MADLLRLLEDMVSSEDGLLFFSACMPITSYGFQLHRVQLSWLFLGCLRSKRKQRPYFLVTLFCLAVVKRGGSLFGCSLLPAAGQGRHWSSRRKCLGFVCHPYPPLFPRQTTGYMQRDCKFALKGREITASEQGVLCFSFSVSCSLSAQNMTGVTACLWWWHSSITAETHHLTVITGFSSWYTYLIRSAGFQLRARE